MPTQNARNIRRTLPSASVSFSGGGAGYVVVDLTPFLGREGRIVQVAVRSFVGSSATTCAVRIFEGNYDALTVDPSTVPDEHIVYDLAAAGLTHSATVASINENVRDATGGAYYGRIGIVQNPTHKASQKPGGLFLALTFDNDCDAAYLVRADMAM